MSGIQQMLLAGKGATGPTAQLFAGVYSSTIIAVNISFNSDGSFSSNVDAGYTWLLSGNASDCKIVYTNVVGDGFTTEPGSGANLGTNRAFTRGATPGNFRTVTADFSIQRVSDSVTIAGPVSITMECDNP